MARIKGKPKHIMYYDNGLIATLTQSYGSVFPEVLPYGLVNVLITFAIYFGKRYGIDTTFSSVGHGFMSVLVSFLVVTRSGLVYARYLDSRSMLNNLLLKGRELVSLAFVLSCDRMTEDAKSWRAEIAINTIITMRITLNALAFHDTGRDVWRYETKKNRRIVRKIRQFKKNASHAQDNMSAPVIIGLNLRKIIMSQRKSAFQDNPLTIREEMTMLQEVEDFLTYYNGLKKLITTPFPFPLVQMARTFLFLWVYSLPFVLTHTEKYDPVQNMILIFFITYGFVGVELVSMALDDPFGDDPTDFDDERLLRVAVDDILTTVLQIDGEDCMRHVREEGAPVQKREEEMVSLRALRMSFYESSFTG